MSKQSAPQEHPPAPNAPPSYSEAVGEGASYQPPPGPAEYKPPTAQAGSYGGYGPPPGLGFAPGPGGAPGGQYGPGPGAPHQQQHSYGQYGAPPGLPVGSSVVVPTHAVTVIGPNPTHMMCPHCHAEIDSSVRASPSSTAWIAGLLIALFGCWMGCCLIPCCMDECMDKEHYCPNCKAFLGRYQR